MVIVCNCVCVYVSVCMRVCKCVRKCMDSNTPMDVMVGALLQRLMPWLTRAQEGATLLMYAIDKDNEGILTALIARGADPNFKITVGARIF